MYNAISHNKRRTWILLLLFVGFFLGLGYLLGEVYQVNGGVGGLTVFGIVAIIYAVIGYFVGARMTLAIAGAREAKREEFFELYTTVENLAITTGIPMPKVYVMDEQAPNAFATGRDPQHAVVAVTRGLLQRLDKTELQGVIAHELSHIQNYDIRLQSLVVALLGVVALMSDLFLRSMIWGRHSRSSGRGGGRAQAVMIVIGILLAILSPIIAKLISLAISRQREYLADASGALLTRYPEGLASALEKIAADPKELEHASTATAHLYLADPLRHREGLKWLNELFQTHPPVEDRVRRLRGIEAQ